tara:strand:+ start:277 stop:456 length:180 start_codon:yes stop_codon:yes gene_type:complete
LDLGLDVEYVEDQEEVNPNVLDVMQMYHQREHLCANHASISRITRRSSYGTRGMVRQER